MDFLKNNRRFRFLYNGKEITNADYTVTQTQEGNKVTSVYTFADGLKVTNIATKHEMFGAYEWVNYFENTAETPSGMITELWDCDVTLPMPYQSPYVVRAWLDWDATVVYAPAGCCDSAYEFYFKVDDAKKPTMDSRLFAGDTKRYAPYMGKSSWMQAPFFNVHKDGKGCIVAVGWTGQWNCQFTREAEAVTIQTKIEDTAFYMMPGERFRTSSVVIMPYDSSVEDAQNKWRRLVKEKYSLIGQPGRPQYAPLSAMYWGGCESQKILDGIQVIRENQLPYEYLWIDAGWNGIHRGPTPDDHEGDWSKTLGDWRVSPIVHPNGLKDVSQAAHEAGMKFLLWFEIERANVDTPIYAEHPEYFLDNPDGAHKKLPNLGDEKVWNYIFELLSEKITELDIDCLRQDANMVRLSIWRAADTEGRKGITEIKYINGLYALWDRLLERFPHLLIDNCASGGKRIDIETLRRSVPLWRSDSCTAANYLTWGMQNQQLAYNAWLPYSGAGTGRILDAYRIRSAYSGSMATAYTIDSRVPFGKTRGEIEFVKKYCEEYLKVRPYFYEDFYPLTQMSDSTDVWSGSQFHRPEQNDGIIQLFRREDAPYETARFDLRAIDENATYRFTDADDDSCFAISGKELIEKGFVITIPQKRTAKIYFYRAD